jgi:hypothetical protein
MDYGSDPKLRILIVTENFLPKVDGVTHTLSRLLEHLQRDGHEALLLGPDSNMYAGRKQRHLLADHRPILFPVRHMLAMKYLERTSVFRYGSTQV